MKQALTCRWPVICALAAFGAQGWAGTIINYPNFNFPCGTNGLTCGGNAATTGGVLRLTSAGGGEAGAAYSTIPVNLGTGDTFSTQFQFRFTDPGGVDPADGITFVLATATNGLGVSGFGLGYSGVGSSVAIEFDTYNNGTAGSLGFFPAEPNSSNHVAIDTGGVLGNTNALNVYGNASCGFPGGVPPQNANSVPGCMSNGNIWTVNIGYDGTTKLLNMTLTDPSEGSAFVAYTNLSVDLSSLLGTNNVFAGFTGSTGAGFENHDILNWTLANTAQINQVPEPGNAALLGAGLIALAWLARRHLQ